MRVNRKFSRRVRLGLFPICLMGVCGYTSAAEDEGNNSFQLGGYVREWASANLQNVPETPQNDRGDISMLRSSVLLDANAKLGMFKWKAIGRVDREYKTNYLTRLEGANRKNSPGGPGSNIMDLYNQGELRELYVDFNPVDRVNLRIGKQQVVWGETDFYHLTDLIHGFDFRWRSFLEVDNDELRKPLILLNGKIAIPEANGNLQIVVRPGLDRDKDIGNTFDLSGGRWALQPFKGTDFLAPGFLTMNYRHPDGNAKNVTGGARWSGSLPGSVNYSLSYLKTFNPNPVVNSAFVPYKEKPVGVAGDFIYPKIDLFGASVSGEIAAIDAVVGAEFAYQRNVPYNVGSNFFNGALPGFGGITKKNVLVTSVRMDKQLRLQPYLGTNQASFFSLQLFDTWIRDYKTSDDLVALAGWGAAPKEHTTVVSGFITLNYANSTINPGLAFGADLSSGDAFLIPSVEFAMGNNWRLRAEADIFIPKNQKRPSQIEQSSYPLGNFANNDQLLVRLTYQF